MLSYIRNSSNENVPMGTRANKLQKLQIPPNKILLMTVLPVFSQLLLIFFSSGTLRTFPLESVISYNL